MTNARVAARDHGLRRLRRYTWWVGAAGVVSVALLVVIFSHRHMPVVQPVDVIPTPSATATHHHHHHRAAIVPPMQTPAPANGGQVTSGGS